VMPATSVVVLKKLQLKLLAHFTLQVAARAAADLPGLHPNTAALFCRKIRHIIVERLAVDAREMFDGPVEPDESYFGGARKGKRGRGALQERWLFLGILKRHGKVCTVIADNTRSSTLMPVIARKIKLGSVVCTGCCRSSCNALGVGDFGHHRINHSTHFAEGENHINGIENFFARLKQYRAIAARCDKTARNFLPAIHLAASVVWLN